MKTLNIKHSYQPTGNTCGPACLYMVLNYMINGDVLEPTPLSDTIEDIAKVCGTDWIAGTPPERMEKGMDALRMKYAKHINSKTPYLLLDSVLSSGNIPILRTFTHNMPHWIIVNGLKNNLYSVSDPWLGEISYTKEELNEIWVGRNHEFYEIVTNGYLTKHT
jgi:predicted double-glycine peptidase